MAEKKRKYVSEFAVNLYSAGWLLMPASQLNSDGEMDEEEARTAKNCHIYLICARPAISFDKNDFAYAAGRIKGSLLYRIDGVEHREQFDTPFELLDGAVGVRPGAYPHIELLTYDAEGNSIRYVPANTFSMAHRPGSIATFDQNLRFS